MTDQSEDRSTKVAFLLAILFVLSIGGILAFILFTINTRENSSKIQRERLYKSIQKHGNLSLDKIVDKDCSRDDLTHKSWDTPGIIRQKNMAVRKCLCNTDKINALKNLSELANPRQTPISNHSYSLGLFEDSYGSFRKYCPPDEVEMLRQLIDKVSRDILMVDFSSEKAETIYERYKFYDPSIFVDRVKHQLENEKVKLINDLKEKDPEGYRNNIVRINNEIDIYLNSKLIKILGEQVGSPRWGPSKVVIIETNLGAAKEYQKVLDAISESSQ